MQKLDYAHAPGVTLLEMLEERGWTPVELARRMGLPNKTIRDMIKGKAGITPEFALQLEHTLGASADFWLNNERRYREHLANVGKTKRCSLRRISDWIEQGYECQSGNLTAACEVWWKAWCGLVPRFRPETDTMQAADALCPMLYSIFNWSQDLQMTLWNGGLRDPQWFPIGERYCLEWLKQFTGESPRFKAFFLSSLADFTFKLGKVCQAMNILEQCLADNPNDPFCYMALAAAHSHLFADRQHHVPFDPARAEQILRQGLARVSGREDRRLLRQRLEDLKEAVPVSQKPLPKRPL